ncbi:MAG: GDP-L-fucose synthase, partial [Bacteroidales bacterium]|nr:GDP-L-fucose synthase [Bacteroidales bacterium]
MKLNAKIYVAGHRGLVGSAIWKSLIEKGFTNLIGRTSAELDLRNQLAVESFFAAEKPEYVFLAAAKVGGIMANSTYRAEFIYDNLMIQNNVIHQAYVHHVKKLLFLGSTCIYPKEAPQPMKEEYLLTGLLEPTNEPYAIAKIAGIKMCEAYNQQYGTDFISVMPTNLYGQNDNFDLEKSHVLPAMLRKIHLGKLLEQNKLAELAMDLNIGSDADILETLKKHGISKLGDTTTVEIWGTGTPLREFMWSEDMADACIYLMQRTGAHSVIPAQARISSLTTTSRGCPSFVNLGTGSEITISDLAYLIKGVVGYQGDFVFNASKPDG